MKKILAIVTFILFAISPLTVAARQPKDKSPDEKAYEHTGDEAGVKGSEKPDAGMKRHKDDKVKHGKEKGLKEKDGSQHMEQGIEKDGGPSDKAYEHAGDKANFKRGESPSSGMKAHGAEKAKEGKAKSPKDGTDMKKGKKDAEKSGSREMKQHEMKKKEGAGSHPKMKENSGEEKTQE